MTALSIWHQHWRDSDDTWERWHPDRWVVARVIRGKDGKWWGHYRLTFDEESALIEDFSSREDAQEAIDVELRSAGWDCPAWRAMCQGILRELRDVWPRGSVLP